MKAALAGTSRDPAFARTIEDPKRLGIEIAEKIDI
jgi:hypothetical protein